MSGKGARSWRTGSSGWGSRHDAVRRSRPLARSDGIGYHKIASKSESEMSKKPTFIACEIIPRSSCPADEPECLGGSAGEVARRIVGMGVELRHSFLPARS